MKKVLLFVLLMVSLVAPAYAESSYPEKPIQLVVPFPPGGGSPGANGNGPAYAH